MKRTGEILAAGLLTGITSGTAQAESGYVYEAGHPSLQEWLLPETPPYPEGNAPNEARVALGKMLFFDNRLSGDGNMSCATCHNPMYGWSDNLPTAKGVKSMVLERATPTVINTGYNTIQMWDGRKATLEEQAMGPMEANAEMNMGIEALFTWLRDTPGYVAAFEKAYPGEGINADTLSRAIATFEREVVSDDSPFDRWVRGDGEAMTAQQVRGFRLFVEKDKGNCAVCHSAPNFTDNGFHNIGLASFGVENPDVGRYAQKPLGLMKGAFKTPTLRDITRTAPYFHDGSAATLREAVQHYVDGGVVKTNLSPNFKDGLALTDQEVDDILAFLQALASPPMKVTLPLLPDGLVTQN